MKKPSVIHWAITSRCNLKCGFCFAFKRKELNTNKCLKIIDKIKLLKIKKLVITGGEPLLKNKIIEILDYAKNAGFKIRLDTNGLLLPKLIPKLNIDAIGISLDGPDKATDKKMRQQPRHFSQVIKSLEKLRDTKMKIIIHTLVTKINYEKIPMMAQLLAKYPIFKWGILEFCP